MLSLAISFQFWFTVFISLLSFSFCFNVAQKLCFPLSTKKEKVKHESDFVRMNTMQFRVLLLLYHSVTLQFCFIVCLSRVLFSLSSSSLPPPPFSFLSLANVLLLHFRLHSSLSLPFFFFSISPSPFPSFLSLPLPIPLFSLVFSFFSLLSQLLDTYCSYILNPLKC